MAKPNSKHKIVTKPIKLVRNTKYQTIAAVVVIVAAAILGYFLFIASHASTPYVSAEAESGQLDSGGIAQKISDTNASGGSAVQFGALPGSGGTGNSLCGFKTGTGPTHSKVMVIWEENEDASNIIGNSSLPYFNTIVKDCGYATNYTSYTHESLPNYLTMTSGLPYDYANFPTDCTPPSSCGSTITNPSIFTQLGNNWKGYAESMPGACYNNNSGLYVARHNPEVYYPNLSNCSSNDISIPTANSSSGGAVVNSSSQLYNDVNSGSLSTFNTVSPNLQDDWHDGTASQMDSWLSAWIPDITKGSDYQSGNLAILIVWDEGSGTGTDVQSKTTAAWLDAYTVPGTKVGTAFDEYSVFKTFEDLTGVSPEIGQSATSMAPSFNL